MRVYLPTTFPRLAAAVAAGSFGPPPLHAYAVTPALREWYASGDSEELEFAAMADAARECLRLLAADPAAPPRRVVVAVDVADAAVSLASDLHEAAVFLATSVAATDVASVLVDDPEAEADIRAAVAAVSAADGGDADAAFVVDGAEDHDLHWYATQEIAALLADMS
ncbi:hypothetical protein [Sporichthya sp.]|uniref:DUF6912 family protein n=1 Tax=Sporichthya sp. TaxID=65475 RepID=UPI00181CB15A|nr:hypothetical protein [Sporichthya sp.]MBA3745813.1 hypothetical protein [Sporichthya sp.]